MIYNKNNLLLHSLTSKNEAKPEINGVLFKKNKTMATDSYSWGEVTNVDKYVELVKDYPELPDKSKPINSFRKKGYIIPAKAVKKVLTNLKEVKNDTLPILENAIFLNSSDDSNSKIATTDLEKVDIVNVKNIKGQYPDTSKVVPDENQEKKYQFVTLDRKKLKQMTELLNNFELRQRGIGAIRIGVKSKEEPVIFKADLARGQQFKGLIIPINE